MGLTFIQKLAVRITHGLHLSSCCEMHLSLHKGQGQPVAQCACLVTIGLVSVFSQKLLIRVFCSTYFTLCYSFNPSNPRVDSILMQQPVSLNLRH